MDFLKNLVFLKFAEGKRTQLLVALALVLHAFGYLSDNVYGQIDFSNFDANLMVQEMLIAMVGTVAAKFDRLKS